MTALALDTYALVTKLKQSGVPEQQAAAQVETLTMAIDSVLEQAKHEYKLDSLATKQDIELLRRDIELLRSDTRVQIAETKADLIRWVVGVGVLQMTLIVGLMLKLAHAI